MNTAYIALGSNLEQPLQNVESAVKQLAQHPDIHVQQCSQWYGSTAVGPGEQPDYVNGAIKVHTRLTALALLDAMQAIENAHGRRRDQRWAARTLDLDLLWYNGETIDNERLSVPHPRICDRNFVLFPLNDLAPGLHINEVSVAEHLQTLNSEGLWTL